MLCEAKWPTISTLLACLVVTPNSFCLHAIEMDCCLDPIILGLMVHLLTIEIAIGLSSQCNRPLNGTGYTGATGIGTICYGYCDEAEHTSPVQLLDYHGMPGSHKQWSNLVCMFPANNSPVPGAHEEGGNMEHEDGAAPSGLDPMHLSRT